MLMITADPLSDAGALSIPDHRSGPSRLLVCVGVWVVLLIFPDRGGDSRRGRSAGDFREEQEVAVYFSHFLFEAPQVRLLLPLV